MEIADLDEESFSESENVPHSVNTFPSKKPFVSVSPATTTTRSGENSTCNRSSTVVQTWSRSQNRNDFSSSKVTGGNLLIEGSAIANAAVNKVRLDI